MIIIKNDDESAWKTSILRWVPVEQSLPEDDLAVLCSDLETIWLGYREAGEWYSVDACEWPEVKYWTYLPDPDDLLPY